MCGIGERGQAFYDNVSPDHSALLHRKLHYLDLKIVDQLKLVLPLGVDGHEHGLLVRHLQQRAPKLDGNGYNAYRIVVAVLLLAPESRHPVMHAPGT